MYERIKVRERERERREQEKKSILKISFRREDISES